MSNPKENFLIWFHLLISLSRLYSLSYTLNKKRNTKRNLNQIELHFFNIFFHKLINLSIEQKDKKQKGCLFNYSSDHKWKLKFSLIRFTPSQISVFFFVTCSFCSIKSFPFYKVIFILTVTIFFTIYISDSSSIALQID